MRDPDSLVYRRRARENAGSAEGGFEGRGRELLGGEAEQRSVRAEALEGPGQVGLAGDADGAAGGDDVE